MGTVGFTWGQAPVDDCALQAAGLYLPADGVDVVLAEAYDAITWPQVVQGLHSVLHQRERREPLVAANLFRETPLWLDCLLLSVSFSHGMHFRPRPYAVGWLV